MAYKFDPTKHGFEPFEKFPELESVIPQRKGKYFVKIISYDNYGGLVYVYNIANLFERDDRVQIVSGTFDTRYETHKALRSNYCGLITSDKFAKELLENLFGGTSNEYFETVGPIRYHENLGKKMRQEYNYEPTDLVYV